jgi:hypothetical protein
LGPGSRCVQESGLGAILILILRALAVSGTWDPSLVTEDATGHARGSSDSMMSTMLTTSVVAVI